MNFADYQYISFARRGRVLEITLNRPEQLNAFNAGLHAEMARVFIDANNDPESEVIVLTGAGRAFSAGGDLEAVKSDFDNPAAFRVTAREGKQIVFAQLDCEKPIIAKVNGPAIGLGCSIALFCDVIFAADTAKFADPHVNVGLVAGDGGAIIWPQLIGYARAKEYLLTGDAITATEAARIGLINHAVPSAELDARVDQFADRLANGATNAIRWTKVATNIGLKQIAHSVMDTCMSYEWLASKTDDHREAVSALLEKRKPAFTGK
ncbi:enoyl-CoA hydratase-related protein [Cupriavidus metallidurans]|uniref:enoyl-CoA hydratase/isomerase family protein n=1 Tax=Cupriavidus TaxID=106589 RepID=UPI0002A26704|nr:MULTISPECIES: enoyl-CoA hydratase-related protein [Cupriavidus]EKZ95381.1 enoyl-CoA hydratase/isomerase [Cupriavidus sp. HMR-1]GMG95119.1 enoyl-CoA hydratase [Cupriavidus sp. TKC]HBD37588.1 enoyl-CoA hydratase [Cupriavidus sp.]HBO78165.1 enoyl-CoA hydratase [Cupriavidus sp.]